MPSRNLRVFEETESLGEINGDTSYEQRREQVLRCLARIIAHALSNQLDGNIQRNVLLPQTMKQHNTIKDEGLSRT